VRLKRTEVGLLRQILVFWMLKRGLLKVTGTKNYPCNPWRSLEVTERPAQNQTETGRNRTWTLIDADIRLILLIVSRLRKGLRNLYRDIAFLSLPGTANVQDEAQESPAGGNS
jgi:hypothetical protein